MLLTPEAILARDFPPKDFDVAFVAAFLGETEPEPLRHCAQVWDKFGPFATWRLLQKTLDLEAGGGVLITDGSRRRTPGGTFFWLGRQWRPLPRQRGAVVRKPTPAADILGPTIEQTLAALPSRLLSGECAMKTTLIGVPGQIVDRTTYVAFKMTGKPAGSLPKGLPPAPKSTITWIVMVGKKQSAKAAASLEAEPTAKVIIEGCPCLQGTAHVLLATQCTTSALQQAKKAVGVAQAQDAGI